MAQCPEFHSHIAYLNFCDGSPVSLQRTSCSTIPPSDHFFHFAGSPVKFSFLATLSNARRAMETNPALGLGRPLVPSDSVSEPSERGTPRAAFVDALFSEDIEQCRQILDAHPELVNTALKHRAHYLLAEPYDWVWGVCYPGPHFQGLTPVVFASLAPRFREECIDSRTLSPAGLAIIALLIERGGALETPETAERLRLSSGRSYWARYLLFEVCRDYDSPEALGLLVQIGADMHTKELVGSDRTLLQVAAERGAIGAVGFLLDRGVPMNYDSDPGSSGGRTPLHSAAANARHQVVQFLLDRGALSDLEKLDWKGCTPLLCCAMADITQPETARDPDRETTIRLLVDAGADLSATDRLEVFWGDAGKHERCSDSLLGHVSCWGSADIIRYLVGKGSDILGIGGSNFHGIARRKVTPLHRAARDWNSAGVQALLDLGAEPDAADEHGWQALHWAAVGQCPWDSRLKAREMSWVWECLQTKPHSPVFLKRLASLESTILHLVQHKASIDRRDALGRTPLHYAAFWKLVGAATVLLQQGANPGLIDNDGRTPLHHLADSIISRRLHEPADSDIEDDTLITVLASQINRVNINHTDSTGVTALHIAACSKSDAAAALLLRLGADPNLPDAQGSTPLHRAAELTFWATDDTFEESLRAGWSRRSSRIKALLLGAGADADALDAQGKTAAEIEEGVRERLRLGRVKYLEYLASPTRQFGRGRGRGRGAGPEERRRAGSPGGGRGNLAPGAGHGRGGA